VAVAIALVSTSFCSDAAAWGCDGHRAVVFVAERLLGAATLSAARATLAAAPIDPALRRFCDPIPDDPIADGATWADDYRDVDPTTFGWHFIDVPRSVALTAANESRYCPGGNCAVAAIAAQFRVLTASSSAGLKGKALRFLLHLVADLHQPLHATTNGDRGGNCVPVTYYDRAPQENPNGDFSPNLHGVWDSLTIRTLMTARAVADARALARSVAAQHPLPAAAAPQRPGRAAVRAWAQQAHTIGRNLVYPRLPVKLALEPASAAMLASCTDNRDIVHRMLAKHEVIDARYERASVPAILAQLRLAGIRLAAVLKAAYP
jgi:hypothetical protein